MRYAQIVDGAAHIIIESDTDPDGTNGTWVACGDAGPGWTYDGTTFSAPADTVPVDPCQWLIDLGPFYDRFSTAKMDVLTSADAAVRAIVQDISIRKWVDLQRPDVATALAYVGSVVAAVTPTLQTAILTTPVTAEENRALRKLYFS